MTPLFIENLQKKRCNYNHPDQATSQANSLILLSSGIYTEEERFVFELLQNAVDAHNDYKKILEVKILIIKDYLVFLHNGDAFTERDIEGLCDVGNGNKMKDVKKIGYKGIGFKSVFMRSTSVVVKSGGYCFKFDKEYWNNYWDKNWNTKKFGIKDVEKEYKMPWQIIPIEANPPIEISLDGFEVATYIRIDNINNVESKIQKLLSSCQFLLFLKSKNIRIIFEVNGVIKSKLTKKQTKNIVTLSSKGHEESKWLIHKNENVEIPKSLKGLINADINTPDKLKEVNTFDLTFAIAIDNNGKLRPLTKEESIIYTYLPTSFRFGSDGFPFLVNANFITDAGRQQLHKDSEWNKLIFSKIPSEYLTWVKELSTTHKNYWEVLPQKTYGRENSLEIIYADNMENAIKEIAFIPSMRYTNQKVLASEAFMDRMGIAEAISTNALVGHINRAYSHSFAANNQISNVWKGSKILQSYGVFIFDKQKLKGLFEDKQAFENISFELDVKLINYLFDYYLQNKTEQDELVSILQSSQFLLDENNSLCLPKELFFPSTYEEQNSLEEDAKFLHNDIYEAVSSNKQIIDWLSLLGVEHLSDLTFIKKVICSSGYVTEDNAIEVGRFLFNVNKNINIFDEIGSYYLSNLKFLSKEGTLAYANDLFLGSFYKPEKDLEKVYKGDIYISDNYCNKEDVVEWCLLFKKLGVNDTLSLTKIKLRETKDYSFLDELKDKFGEEYNIGSWGNKFYYSFSYFHINYAPFVLTNECSRDFLKLIWSSILSEEYISTKDSVEGWARDWRASRTFEYFNKDNFIVWAFRNIQLFPSTDGDMQKSENLFLNTDEIKSIAGSYLPVIDIDTEIHDSWKELLPLRNTINISECLEILSKISHDITNTENNKERICKIYQKLIDLDALSKNNRKKIKEWASYNLILSKEDEFVSPSKLSHITLDGFSSKNRVYIGNPSNKEKVIELLALMGVKIITSESIRAEFESKKESHELKHILKAKNSALALLASGEDADETFYRENKIKLTNLIEQTHFYHCEKIKLTYGDSTDAMEKHTFGNKNEFYYIGNLRPANVESLLTPLCKYLGINKKERELFLLFIEDMDGIRQNLKDKGYTNVSLLEEETITESGNIQTYFNHIRTESQYDRDVITGFKGEIIVYEKLISMGYQPQCLSISTKDDYTHEITMNGKTYFCKPNYEKYDISFMTNNGVQMYVEVKATTMNKNCQENLPISYRELTMIEECNDSEDKSYIIVRVFGIDKPNQDIYIFKGHIF